jgi:hypothetical protein
MKEEVRQTASQEADLPAIFHKTWQAETNCGAPFSTLPEFFTVHLSARSPVLTCLSSIAMGTKRF